MENRFILINKDDEPMPVRYTVGPVTVQKDNRDKASERFKDITNAMIMWYDDNGLPHVEDRLDYDGAYRDSLGMLRSRGGILLSPY